MEIAQHSKLEIKSRGIYTVHQRGAAGYRGPIRTGNLTSKDGAAASLKWITVGVGRRTLTLRSADGNKGDERLIPEDSSPNVLVSKTSLITSLIFPKHHLTI
jgi:hypothetical protein